MTNEIEYVTVKTLSQLQRALQPYRLDGRTNARELLLDGLKHVEEQIKRHEDAEKEIVESQDAFGGIMPASMQHPSAGYHFIDSIIDKKLGGKRVGSKIRWITSEGIYEWDAFKDELIKCSGK